MTTSGRQGVLKFRTTQVPRQQGEFARLRVVRGPDQGAVFVVMVARVTLGRGEEASMMISDLKASRLHAELSLASAGWQIRDLGSSNGVLVNGAQLRSAMLKSGDLLTLGETVLEFLGSEAPTQLLSAPIQNTQIIEKQMLQRRDAHQRARSLMDPFGISLPAGASVPVPGAPAPRLPAVRIVMIALACVLGLALLGDDEKPGKAGVKQSGRRAPASGEGQQRTDFESLLPKLDPPAGNKAADMFFKQGFREFRARNYFRARAQFDLVLQIVPDHELARRYRENCNRAIEEEVGLLMEQGRNSLSSGKLREARGHYENVLRLLNGDQANPAFQEARDQLQKVVRELEVGSP